jgi:hypothetical protein
VLVVYLKGRVRERWIEKGQLMTLETLFPKKKFYCQNNTLYPFMNGDTRRAIQIIAFQKPVCHITWNLHGGLDHLQRRIFRYRTDHELKDGKE